MSSVAEIAKKVVELNQQGKAREAITALCSAEIVSVEPNAPPSGSAESRGVEAVLKKHDWWEENFEVHSLKMSGPFVNQDRFTIVFKMDATSKFDNKRTQMEEVGLYTVVDGKITREEFFY